MSSKLVSTKIDGLNYIVSVPSGVDAQDYAYGMIIGPPEAILHIEINVADLLRRLHQELYARNLITCRDTAKRRQDIIAALQSVLKLDAEKIINAYCGGQDGS